MAKQKIHKLLVYGTLRERYGDGKIIPATHVLNGFRMYDAGRFPYIVPDKHGKVMGNVLHITDDQLAGYDSYEGAPSFYSREVVKAVPIDKDKEEEVFVYVGNSVKQMGGREINSGDWSAR